MKRTKQKAAILGGLVAAAALVAGCSSSTSSPVESSSGESSLSATPDVSIPESPSRNALGTKDCGGSNGGTYATVGIANRTNGALSFKAIEVDCYDWYGTSNPTKFDGKFAIAGADIAPLGMKLKEIGDGRSTIRPWNFEVTARADGGPSLSGQLVDRPTYRFAKTRCYTSNTGSTVCSGVSLCTQDPNLKKVETTLPLRNREGVVVTTLTATTVCTATDSAAEMVFKGTLPTS